MNFGVIAGIILVAIAVLVIIIRFVTKDEGISGKARYRVIVRNRYREIGLIETGFYVTENEVRTGVTCASYEDAINYAKKKGIGTAAALVVKYRTRFLNFDGVIGSYQTIAYCTKGKLTTLNNKLDTHSKEELFKPIQQKHYRSHCWNCKENIDSHANKKCSKCNTYYICSCCGKCKCDSPYH